MSDGRIEQFRKAAHDLQLATLRLPTVEEVANSLQLNVGECRSILREHHRTTGLSWRELGVIGYPLTEERQRLRDALQIVCTPRAQIFLISKLLEQQRLRYLSTSETRMLVYAVITREYRFETLDKEYSKLIGTTPKNVSNRLHDTRRSALSQRSFFDRLEEEISLNAAKGGDVRSREYPYREFLGNVITLLRGALQEHPFAGVLKASSNRAEAAKMLAPYISTILERKVDPALIISPNHSALLRSLIEKKTNSSFLTLKKFGEDLAIDQSGLLAALNGRGKYLGLIDKLREMDSRYTLIAPDILSEPLTATLEKVRKAKSLSHTEASTILKLLGGCENIQCGITGNQSRCLSLLLNEAILGNTTSTREIAGKLGCTEDSVNQLLRDRGSRPGAIRWLDTQLSKISELPVSKIATLLYPYSTDFAHGAIQKLAELPPLSPPLSRLYSLALSALDSFAQQLDPLPKISVTTNDGRESSVRILNSRELGQLVVGYVSSAKGDLSELRRNFTSILQSKENIRISQKVATKIKRGLVTEGGITPGAISKLCTIIDKYRDVFEHLKAREKYEITTVELSESNSSASLNSNVLHVAHEIVSASIIHDSIAITGVFCSTRPHSAREVIRVTQKLVERTEYHDLSRALKDLERVLRYSPSTIDSEEFRNLFIKLLANFSAKQRNELDTLVSCFASCCAQRRIPLRVGAHFLYMLHQSKEESGSKGFIEAWGKVCSLLPTQHSKGTVRFMRAAYTQFIELAFSSELPLEALKNLRWQYQELLKEVTQVKSAHFRSTENTHKLLREFYNKYTIAKIIQKYCYYHLQSPTRPHGLPFDDLYDIAIQAVLEATTKFDPEKFTSAGRPPPTFSTFAVNMIRWSISRHSHIHQKDRKKIAFSLNEKLGNDEDGDSFLSVVADLSQASASDTQVEIAGLSSEQVIPLLNDLSPLARRVIELRFYIGEHIHTNDSRSLRKIAEIIYSEGITPQVVSGEAIRLTLQRALKDLRCGLWRRSLPSWIEYLKSPDECDIPTPVILPVIKHKTQVTPEIKLDMKGTGITKSVVLEVHKVTDGFRGELDIFVKALEPKDLKQVALFLISVKKGKVQACERLDG